MELKETQRARAGKKDGSRFIPKVQDELSKLNAVKKTQEQLEYEKRMFSDDILLETKRNDTSNIDNYHRIEARAFRAKHYFFDPYKKNFRAGGLSFGEILFYAGKSRGEALAIIFLYYRQIGRPEMESWANAEAAIEDNYDPLKK